ncbi:hypothetical protein [Chlorobaculum thiosulfatiphilum]|uniref:hypothetical protein n=1 Tax=Chlorobaculum thiosulfatiphilum TaxID=115852 RepID=UPI001476A248|nr:hypothetical protein [Chlorobaculum thiosulfatiphilum]
MKTEVKIAIIGGIVTIIGAIITGFFGWLTPNRPEPQSVKPDVTAPATQPTSKPANPPSQTVEKTEGNVTIINGDNNIHAGKNVTIHGEKR